MIPYDKGSCKQHKIVVKIKVYGSKWRIMEKFKVHSRIVLQTDMNSCCMANNSIMLIVRAQWGQGDTRTKTRACSPNLSSSYSEQAVLVCGRGSAEVLPRPCQQNSANYHKMYHRLWTAKIPLPSLRRQISGQVHAFSVTPSKLPSYSYPLQIALCAIRRITFRFGCR